MNKALVKFLLVPHIYTVKGKDPHVVSLDEACWGFSERSDVNAGSVCHYTGAGGYLMGSDFPKIITEA